MRVVVTANTEMEVVTLMTMTAGAVLIQKTRMMIATVLLKNKVIVPIHLM